MFPPHWIKTCSLLNYDIPTLTWLALSFFLFRFYSLFPPHHFTVRCEEASGSQLDTHLVNNKSLEILLSLVNFALFQVSSLRPTMREHFISSYLIGTNSWNSETLVNSLMLTNLYSSWFCFYWAISCQHLSAHAATKSQQFKWKTLSFPYRCLQVIGSPLLLLIIDSSRITIFTAILFINSFIHVMKK